MKITKVLSKNNDNNYELNGRWAVCGEAIQHFIPNPTFPPQLVVTISNKRFAGSRPIFIRIPVDKTREGGCYGLGCTCPSSWTLERNQDRKNPPTGVNGFYSAAYEQIVQLYSAATLLAVKENKPLALYVRMDEVTP